MIDYELAKKLKDAGFPTKHYVGSKFYLNDKENTVVGEAAYGGEYHFRDNETYIPTLSELIEACGEDFGMLVRNYLGITFTAFSETGHLNNPRSEIGKTAEDAVANLWMTLNPKTA